MTGGFRRSSWFGIIGVLVVMGAVAVIGLTMGSGRVDDPKPIYALIFAIVAVFLIILFALQRADLNRVAGGDARAYQRAAVEGHGERHGRPVSVRLGGGRSEVTEGIVVSRKGGSQSDWMCDLWLAERLASAC